MSSISRPIVAALALLIASVLQVLVAPNISLLGGSPNFLLIIVVVMALSEGSSEGATLGFIAGLLFDLLGSGPVGPAAFVLTLVGYVAGSLHQNMFSEGWIAPLIVLGTASLLGELVYMLVLVVLGSGMSFGAALLTKVLPNALYSLFIGVVSFPLVARAFKKDKSVSVFQQIR